MSEAENTPPVSQKRIRYPEISIVGGEIVLISEDKPAVVSKELSKLHPDLLEAVKLLYIRYSNLERDRKVEILKSENLAKEIAVEKNAEEIISFSELLKKEFLEIPWDIEGIFESGTINMISAPPNQYKSWIVQYMAICLAQGKLVFDKYQTKKQGVLIINEEDNLRMIKDRSLKMIVGTEDLNVHFLVMSGFKVDEDSIDAIYEEIRARGLTFVIFDSLRSVHDANENDSQEMQEVMDCFKRLTKKGITVLFTHHNRKKVFGKNKDESGEESRGSTAINAAVHGHISSEEILRDDGTYLLISQRKLKCDEKLKPFLVKVDADRANNKMSFSHAGEYDAKEDTFRKNKELTIKIVEDSDQWLSRKEIEILAGIGASALSKILQELEREKKVESKTKKELEKEGVRINDLGAKHNAKFYFRKDKPSLDELVSDLQNDTAL